MYIHNLDPVILEFGVISLRWYSLSYVAGILFGWWYGKKIISRLNVAGAIKFSSEIFDDLITILVLSIIIGGRLGYVIFYNFDYYLDNPYEILMIWKGGMSFHGGLIGIVVGSLLFSIKRKIKLLILLDIVSLVAPVGIFFGRISNFINSELFGKPTDVPWGVIFPKIDELPRHPSQIYEAILEGAILFFILNLIIKKLDYIEGRCAAVFLITYSIFRIFAEQFREPDIQVGYIFNFFSMGTLLSTIMLLVGLIMYLRIK